MRKKNVISVMSFGGDSYDLTKILRYLNPDALFYSYWPSDFTIPVLQLDSENLVAKIISWYFVSRINP